MHLNTPLLVGCRSAHLFFIYLLYSEHYCSFVVDCFHMRGGVPHLGGLPGQPCRGTRLGGVRFLHVNAEGGTG